MRPGEVRYTSIGDAQIAYQVTDTGGPVDFVYMIGQGSAFELWWDHPLLAKPFERFASFGRLIMFDRRGCGLSDRPPSDRYPSWEHFAEDLEAVLDAAGSERAAILAAFDGGPTAMTFAATHPERVSSLILWNSYARWYAADDYPIGQPLEQHDVFQSISELWGTEAFAKMIAPDEANDDEAMRWLARCLRFSETPKSWAAESARQMVVDARPVLPLIVAPTLVMYRRGYLWNASGGLAQYLADHIAGARLMEFGGQGSGVWGVESDEIIGAIEEFVTGFRPKVRTDRVLATVLFTDIVGSTQRASELGDERWKELLAMHDATAERVLGEWRGELVKTTGDGLLARFDGPGRAIGCAQDLMKELRHRNIDIRAGVHAGEIELREDGDIGGIAVHIAARVQAKAGAGELLCSRTVKDLTAGAGLTFDDRGVHELKGVPDRWQLFAVA
jgi:class 3 adenylate cyclase/pimeloyl-ACP methyl ester carboxylesterase